MRRLMLVIACVCWVTPAAAQRPTVHTTVQTTATTASSLLVGCALGATTGCTGGINSGPIVVNSGGINIVSNVPGDTTMKLYNNSGTLTWNGTPLAAGSSLSGTTGTIAIFTASNAVGNSIITQTGGTTITVTGTLNATTAIQLNGTSINTAGTLSNVAYLNAANTFSNASGQTFAGGIGLSGGSPSTHGIMIPSAVPGITTTNLYNNGGVLTWSGGASFPGNVTVTTLNTYTFNQSVASGASPTLTGTNFTGIPAASILAGTFGSGNYTIPGLLTVSGFGTHLFSAGGTGGQSLEVTNTTSGTGNFARVYVTAGTSSVLFGALSQGFTTSGVNVQSGAVLNAEGAGGLSLAASNASGDIRLYSRNTLALTLGASQAASFTGDLSLAATKKLYLDGGGDTYITESSANRIAFVSGGTEMFVVNSGVPINLSKEALGVEATKKLYLDGGGDTYIQEGGANTIDFYAGGTLYLRLQNSGGQFFEAPVVYNATSASAANVVVISSGQLLRSTSSLRYKHDIDTLDADHALSAVMAMRPVTYRGKTDEDQRRYVGFIAEEMQTIAPLLATYDEGGESGTPNYVTYDRVTAYLVAVVQQQQTEISALKARIH